MPVEVGLHKSRGGCDVAQFAKPWVAAGFPGTKYIHFILLMERCSLGILNCRDSNSSRGPFIF